MTTDTGYAYLVTAIGPDGFPLPGVTIEFELDNYVGALLRTDPLFARAYYQRHAAEPLPLCIDGHEYRRRQRTRRLKRR
jgi:hypothetical protein